MDDKYHLSGYSLESTLTPNTSLPKSLAQLESRHSSQSSGKEDKAKNPWLPGKFYQNSSLCNMHYMAPNGLWSFNS